MSQFLKSRYENNADIIERIGYSLKTERDFKEFMNLAVALYESGFIKAVEDYRQHFEKQGIKIEITPQKTVED